MHAASDLRASRSVTLKVSAVSMAAIVAAGCSLQSAYITKSEVVRAEPTVCTRDAIDCAGQAAAGAKNARCTEDAFETALRQHAIFASTVGEVLLPLAGIVAFKGAYDQNAHNFAALATGGFAAYGVGQYLYKKPREEIYLTGVSAIECARRLTDGQRISDADRAYLLGVAGDESAADKRGEMGRADITDAKSRVAHAQALGMQALDTLDKHAGCPDLSEQRTRVVARRASFAVLERRLAIARGSAIDLVRASDLSDVKLCRATDQIRADVNHMLVSLTPDPEKLAGSLVGLKPAVAPPPETVPGDGDKKDSPPLLLKTHIKSKACIEEKKAMSRLDAELSESLVAATRAIDSVEVRISRAAKDDSEQDELLARCGVDSVSKPLPLALTVNGAVDVVQGSSYQIGISGGRRPYKWVLANLPKEGNLSIELVGSAALGYMIKVSPDAKTTKGNYGIVISDGNAALATVVINVISST